VNFFGIIFTLFVTTFATPDPLDPIPPAAPLLLSSILILINGLYLLREYMENNPTPENITDDAMEGGGIMPPAERTIEGSDVGEGRRSRTIGNG